MLLAFYEFAFCDVIPFGMARSADTVSYA